MTEIQKFKGFSYRGLLIIILVFPIISNFNKYYISKNYDYLIETRCDSVKEKCFIRDCAITDECPPNELSSYKVFYVKAYDFEKCTDNECEQECSSNLIQCTPKVCSDLDGDVCSEPSV